MSGVFTTQRSLGSDENFVFEKGTLADGRIAVRISLTKGGGPFFLVAGTHFVLKRLENHEWHRRLVEKAPDVALLADDTHFRFDDFGMSIRGAIIGASTADDREIWLDPAIPLSLAAEGLIYGGLLIIRDEGASSA